jgi:hypothetical protein
MEQEKLMRVVRIFVRLINKVDPKWKLPGGIQAVSYIDNGLVMLEREFPLGMADDRITDFIVYQVYRYLDNITGAASTHFMYTWCWSENAVKKFRNQYFGDGNPRIDYYIDQWLKTLGINRKQITDYISGPKPNKWRKYIEMPSDELIKRRFHNTENGFILCSTKTMGWSPGSGCCKECNFVEKCLQVTERRYPELLRLRREEDGKGKK